MSDMTLILARYETEIALASADVPTRLEAVRTAYFVHNFDVDQISTFSGFPVWRVRQLILGSNPKPHPKEDS